jgi:hypothetical protein
MDKRDLALDKAAHEDIVAVANRSRHREDFVTFLMRPPATPNWLPSYRLSKRRNRPVRGLEYDTVLTNEGKSLACSHRHVVIPSAEFVILQGDFLDASRYSIGVVELTTIKGQI